MLVLDKMKWHAAADVVVAGFGGAGAVAAVTAHDNGADVLLLEKQAEANQLTNTSMAGGAFISPDDVKGFGEYLATLARVDRDLYWTDRDTIKVWAEYTCQNREWVEKMGGKIVYWPQVTGSHREVPGNNLIKLYNFEKNGVGFMEFLKEIVAKRNIRTMYETSARRLITNTRGEVIGITARNAGGAEINIKAARGVILATGGFEFNETMKLNYLRCYPIHFHGTPANTGDGVKMVMSVGADLWHMNCAAWGFVMKFPDAEFAFGPALRGNRGRAARGSTASSCGYIVVDKSGRRYTNENYKQHHVGYELAAYDSRGLNYPRIPSYWIMDQRRISDGPLPASDTSGVVSMGLFDWSRDNKKEMERGWIIPADTVGELARKLGMEADTLQKTVETYNGYCRNNADLDFRRRPESLVALDSPPYYAVRLWPGGPNTQGGPHRNWRSQVLSVESGVIPGLYAVGELGSEFGMLYTGGGNLAECISSGRLAGENAAREKPRTIA